jgi:SP family general alpha glucoside:H+ symporter-like MFS transporter
MANSTPLPSEKESEKVAHTHHGESIPPEALATEARHAANAEHGMTLWQAIKTYPKAIGWSMLLSSCLIMEGYDLALLGNLYASQTFNAKYGTWDPENEKFQVSAAWQSGLSNGARAGEIVGLIIAGWTADRYGYKMTTIGFLVLMIACIFVLFFAPNVQVLVAGEVLCGKLQRRLKSIGVILTLLQAFHGARSSPSPQHTHLKSPLSRSDLTSRRTSTCAG